MNISNKFPNILSVDYEDWWTTNHYRNVVSKSKQVNLLEYPTMELLDVLDRYDTKITFFTLGLIAKKHPELIKEIAKRGHEIASHGYSHTNLNNLSPEQFIIEIQETNKILEDLIQDKIIGFRAPYFSINTNTSWAIDILVEEGFKYDSSIFPMKISRYGIKDAPLTPYFIHSDDLCAKSKNTPIVEIPVSIYKNRLIDIPCGGGIYGRFLPISFWLFLLKRIHEKQMLNIYFHPWELINKKDLLPYPGFKNYILSNYSSEKYMWKIENVLREYNFQPAKVFIKGFLASN